MSATVVAICGSVPPPADAPEADLAQIKPDVSFRDQLDIDPIAFLNFVIALDKEMGLEMPDADYPKLDTFNEREAQESRERAHAQQVQQGAEAELSGAGLKVSSVIVERDPQQLLMDEAEAWDADSIFVGASGHGQVEPTPLGSVGLAVITRAHGSVEVVRRERTA